MLQPGTGFYFVCFLDQQCVNTSSCCKTDYKYVKLRLDSHDNLSQATMRNIRVLVLLIIFICIGCTGKSIKPSADSRSATETFDIINTIRTAYEEKDKAALQSHMSALLAENTIKGLFFEKAELTITPRMVTITDESIRVNAMWSGSWWLNKDKKLENRGVADLVFHKGSMKLTYIDGDNPFILPSEKNRTNSFPVLYN